MGAGVFSHWVLDFVTHRPDVPILPEGPHVGLGLWNSLLGTILVEGSIFVAGVAVYARATQARDAKGRYGLAALVLLLVFLGIGAWFGPPPPSEKALAVGGLALWLVVPFGYWLDRHRRPAA